MAQHRLDANLHWLFTELPFPDRFAAAAAAGFTGVEMPDAEILPPRELERRLRDNGLELVLVNSPAGERGGPARAGFASLPDAEDEFREGILRTLDIAAGLGARAIHLRAGLQQPGITRDRTLDLIAERASWAAEAAAGSGVLPVLEAQNGRDVPGFAFRSVDDAAAIVRAIGADRVGLLLDVYHLEVMHGRAVERLPELLPIAGHIQIAEAPHRTEPGSGALDWQAAFDAIAGSGYDGWIGCEYRPTTTTEASLGWRSALGLEASDARVGA